MAGLRPLARRKMRSSSGPTTWRVLSLNSCQEILEGLRKMESLRLNAKWDSEIRLFPLDLPRTRVVALWIVELQEG